MSTVDAPCRTSGLLSRGARHLGGRSHVLRTAGLSIALAVVAGVVCGLLAPGSREVLTGIGDLPARPQDEVRVAAEVWFTLAMAAVAVLTTILWWRPWPPRGGSPGRPDPVEEARGPVGLLTAASAAMVQSAAAILVWQLTVSLRDFAEPGEIGEDRIAAPILSGAVSVWVAAAGAVLTYLVLVILAPTSTLTSSPPGGVETDDRNPPPESDAGPPASRSVRYRQGHVASATAAVSARRNLNG